MVKHEGTRLLITVQNLLVPLRIGTRSSPAGACSALTALTKRLIRRIISEIKTVEFKDIEAKHKRKQVTAGHIAQVMHLARAGTSGHVLDLPGGIAVEREFDRLLFFRGSTPATDHPGYAETRAGVNVAGDKDYEYKVTLDAQGHAAVKVAEIGSIFHLKVIDWPSLTSETRLLVAALDQALLRPPLLLRNWRPGDSFRPRGRKRARKLKRLLLEKRVGLRDRAGWPVLTSAGMLVWVRGLPVSAEVAPRHGTRTTLVIAEEAL
jgi:tRNA(Ile)-lysidine synthetase-like protein